MHKFIFSFFVLFFFYGCTEKAVFERDSYGNIVIKSHQLKIEDADIEEWRVGPLKRQKITKGIRLGIKFPVMEVEDLQTLGREKEVDSWLIRVKKRGNVGTNVMGYFYVPLVQKGSGGSSLRVKQFQKGFFYVFYAAAAMSKRFELLACPAFNHRKVIENIDLSPALGKEKTFTVSKVSLGVLSAKIEKFGYHKMIFNGGMDLTGEYFIELAFYNSEKKERKSDWVEVSERVTVESEREKEVKGCVGSEVPPRPKSDDVDPVQKYKFGR